MGWKDFFFFTKQEKRGLIVLLVIILLLVVVYGSLPYLIKPNSVDDESIRLQVVAFEQQLQEQSKNTKLGYTKWNKKNDLVQIKLQEFDPNDADSTLFIQLGLKPFVVSRILKYRAKGGLFKNESDFSKIYGLLPETYEQLLPYIRIKPIPSDRKVVADTNSMPINPASIDKELVDVNVADTAMLKSVKGIGSVLSKRIITYREKLGGFISIEQIKEVYGITEESYAKIAPQLTISSHGIRKLAVNNASVHQLKQHPYISFYQAKSMYEYRMSKRNKRLETLEEIPVSRDITTEFIERIKPYISFE
jgi:competence protein ComEA